MDNGENKIGGCCAAVSGGTESFCFPEVLCGREQTSSRLQRALLSALEKHDGVIVTGVDETLGIALSGLFPEGEYDPAARIFHIDPPSRSDADVFIVTAGQKDLPGALAAKYTLSACGFSSTLLSTEGSTSLKELADIQDRLRSAAACIAVAGTDTTLPGLISGMVKTPVIALPVSVNDGDRLSSVMSLLGALGSGRTGLVVVGTDNGTGAGFAAARICSGILKKSNQ